MKHIPQFLSQPIGFPLPKRAMEKMAYLDAVDETSDEAIASALGGEAPDSPYGDQFRGGAWEKVTCRAFAVYWKLALVRIAQNRSGFNRESMERSASLVGEYHVWKHTPRIERTDDWPKNKSAFCEGYGITPGQLEQALTLCRYNRWEARYLESIDPRVRASIAKDILLAGAVRQLDAQPGKENANWMRTLLQSDGEIKGTQKVTQVNIGSNVVNMPEGVTGEQLQQRLEAVNRLAQRLNAKEVPHHVREEGEGSAQEVAQGSRGREVQGAPGEAQEGAGGAGHP